jgi:hypothetical protein
LDVFCIEFRARERVFAEATRQVEVNRKAKAGREMPD